MTRPTSPLFDPPQPKRRRDPDTGDVIAAALPSCLPLTVEEFTAAAEHVKQHLIEPYRRHATPDERKAFVAEIADGFRRRRELRNLPTARRMGRSIKPRPVDPPTPGRGSRVVTHTIDGKPDRWITIPPGLSPMQRHQRILWDLASVGPFKSITVEDGRLQPPRGGNTHAYTDSHGNNHCRITLADDLDDVERAVITRHELGHLIDLCASADWQEVFAHEASAERVAEAFEHPHVLDTACYGDQVIERARRLRAAS